MQRSQTKSSSKKVPTARTYSLLRPRNITKGMVKSSEKKKAEHEYYSKLLSEMKDVVGASSESHTPSAVQPKLVTPKLSNDYYVKETQKLKEWIARDEQASASKITPNVLSDRCKSATPKVNTKEYYVKETQKLKELIARDERASACKITPKVYSDTQKTSSQKMSSTTTKRRSRSETKQDSPSNLKTKRTSRILFPSTITNSNSPRATANNYCNQLKIEEDDKENTSMSPKPINYDDDNIFDTSSAEFEKIESICSARKSSCAQIDSSLAIFEELEQFIEAKQEKMLQDFNDYKKAIALKINEAKTLIQQNALAKTKTNNIKLKRQSASNLRVNALKNNLRQKTVPDTPSTTTKMKKAIEMYNSFRGNLDSPRRTTSSLTTPTSTSKNSRKGLSIKLQKQCLALME